MRLITDDDETLFASFLCLRYKPHVIICFRSMRMADPKYPGGTSVTYQEREFETALAMKTLGVSTWTQWHIPDTEKDPELVEPHLWALRDPSGQDDWDIVIAPAVENDGHPQHNMIGELADMVFTDCDRMSYLTYTSRGRSKSDFQVEFESDWIALKLHALACYKTQSAHPETRAHFIDGGLREYLQ